MKTMLGILVTRIYSMMEGIPYILVWMMVKGPEIINSLAQAF